MTTIRKNIFIVDDDHKFVRMLEYFLQEKGYATKAITDGEQVLKLLNNLIPDLLIIDVMMPNLNGYQTLRKIRGNFRTINMPIIFISALSHIDEKIKALRQGADDYFYKPVDIEDLIVRINEIFAIPPIPWNENILLNEEKQTEGNLTVTRVACLLNILEKNRLNGMLFIKYNQLNANISIMNGKIIKISIDDDKTNEMIDEKQILIRLLSLPSGYYHWEPGLWALEELGKTIKIEKTLELKEIQKVESVDEISKEIVNSIEVSEELTDFSNSAESSEIIKETETITNLLSIESSPRIVPIDNDIELPKEVRLIFLYALQYKHSKLNYFENKILNLAEKYISVDKIIAHTKIDTKSAKRIINELIEKGFLEGVE